MATTVDGYWKTYTGFCSSDTYKEVFLASLEQLGNAVKLPSATCVTLGPGEGVYEIALMKHCAASVSKLTAVEPDRQSVERLKVHLAEYLPGVTSEVVETDVQRWNGPESPIDLVVSLHMLYYVRPHERKELFRNIHDRWLAPGGFLIVSSSSRTRCPGNANELYARLGTPMPAWEDIDDDVLAAGFVKQHSDEIQYERDFSNPTESFLRFYQKHIEHPVTLDEVRDAIKKLFPHGTSDQVFSMLAVYRKP